MLKDKQQTIAIMDGDVYAYRACRPRNQKYSREGFVMIGEHKPDNAREFSAEENERYIEESWGNFQELVIATMETTGATSFLMAVKSPQNYRDLIFPPDFTAKTGYKGNRGLKEGTVSNNFVRTMRQRAIASNMAIEAVGREADDMIRIWATEAEAAGHKYVICSIDKDLKCIPGKHFIIDKKLLITVTPEYATRFYFTQLLSGDPTDNIPGLPGIGPKKAEKLLDQYDTEQEFQAVVIEAYKAYYPTDWRSTLLANGKLIHIQRTITDHFNIRGWAQFAE
jgi:hypothetical protein